MKKYILIIVIIISSVQSYCQGGLSINSTSAPADQSAMLDVSSVNKGILIPRMTENEKNNISSPATGLMIYQTDGTTGFWYYDGIKWVQAIGPQGPTGPAGSSSYSCPSAQSGETLINYNGCLYVKNIDETGSYAWADALNICKSYGTGWYLPGKSELNILYENWNQPSAGGTCYGGNCPLNNFTTNYWSSTVYDVTYAWAQYFMDGVTNTFDKTITYNVRCVRR